MLGDMVFVMRKLDRTPGTLGEKLRELRRGQAITMDMLVRDTRIQRKYLIALERGDYLSLPEPLYTRNFIRSYARYLGADEQYFIELYEEECGRCDLTEPSMMPRQKVRRASFFAGWRMIVLGLAVSVVLSLFSYIGWQFYQMTRPPLITLYSPQENTVVDEPSVLVEGRVDKSVSVKIDGEHVALREDGRFSYELPLTIGVNTVYIEASRRYSKKNIIERTIVYNSSTALGFSVE